MRRSIWHRTLAALLAPWFAFLVAEPATVMHRCPMHDGIMAASAMHGMAAHGHDRSPTAPAHHHCTCIGGCTAAGATGLPAPRVVLRVAIVTATPRNPGLPEHVYLPLAAEHARPFANAPPLA